LKQSSELPIPLETGAISALVYPAESPVASLILGHGAGAGQRSPFMVACATGLAARGLDVITFDFAYMAAKRKMPDRGPLLEATYQTVIDTVRGEIESARRFLFIGGKSMGGRIASQVAGRGGFAPPPAALVFFGYPLHPPNQPGKRRDAHLPQVPAPMLFLHGTRDPFGSPDEMRELVASLGAVVYMPHNFTLSGVNYSPDDTWRMAFALGGGLKLFVHPKFAIRLGAELLGTLYFYGASFYAGTNGSALGVTGGIPTVSGNFTIGLTLAP